MGFKEEIKCSIKNNSEFYKVYDKSGHYIKDIDIKDEKNLTDEYLYGVTCFVVNEKNEILMEVRANTELTPGKIDLVSGHVNGNEVGVQAMIRELDEEVGIHGVLGNQLHRVSELAKPLGFESKGKIRNFLIDFYCMQTKKSHFRIQPEEVESLKWIPMEEAFEMIKLGKTKFPKQQGNVNYDKIFKNVREKCLNQNPQEKKVMEK
ncbi:MAG: NUDIX hydrolase [Clostridia bacterium]|nr:NUDIX hydrolase [Clostridia bacterium]